MKLSKVDIDRNSTVENCKICGGQGTIIVNDGKERPTKHPGKTIKFPRAVVCECRRNEIVENTYPLLGNKKLPKIKSAMAERVAGMFPLNNNYWFEGNKQQFFYMMKAVFVHNRKSSKFLGYVANGLEMILEYYVEQPKDSERRFHDLVHSMDLVVLVCNTKVSNAAVGPGMVELVQGRIDTGKAVWIFTEPDFDSCTEFSDDLKELMGEHFVHNKIAASAKKTTASDALRGGANA